MLYRKEIKKMQDKQKRARNKPLTKEWLKSVGIELKMEDGKTVPTIYHTRRGKTVIVKPGLNTQEKKFGKPMSYYIVSWSINGKQFSTSFARLVYVWYHGDIPEGLWDIDHIDNNTLNNNPDNLRLLSHKENIQKRPNHGCNQYKNSRTMGICKK